MEWHSANDETGDRKGDQHEEKPCSDNDPVIVDQTGSQKFVEVTRQGKMNLYTPLVSQADYQAHESRSVLEKLYGNSLKKFVTSLYQGKKISSEEIQDLSDFLKELDDREE